MATYASYETLPEGKTSNLPVSRVESLRAKHSMYKDLIRQAQQSPSTTDFYLRQLKKQKLMIKEELEGIRTDESIRQAS